MQLNFILFLLILVMCSCSGTGNEEHVANELIDVGSTAEWENSDMVEVTLSSDNVGVAKYLGLGYDLLRANPFSIHLDAGLKSNSLKPTRLLKTFFMPNATCPLLTQCLVSQSHDAPYLEQSSRETYMRSFADYQSAVKQHLHIFGSSTSNLSSAIGLLDGSLDSLRHELADGTFFMDTVSMNTSEEAELNFRASDTLSTSLLTALCELPSLYNRDEYLSFIKEFGTHIVVKIRLVAMEVKRVTIDASTLYEGMKDAGLTLNHTQLQTGSLNGYFVENVTVGLLARIARKMQRDKNMADAYANAIAISRTSTPIPIVTALRELPYFVTRERFQNIRLPSDACSILNEQDTAETEENISRLRANLLRALTDYADETRSRLPTTTPHFVPWPSGIQQALRAQAQPPPLPLLARDNPCANANENNLVNDRFLGRGYDIFRADPFTPHVDTGLHLSPALLQHKSCVSTSTPSACNQSLSLSCVAISSSMPEQIHYTVMSMDDYESEINNVLRLPDLIPAVAEFAGKLSPSYKTIKAHLSKNLYFTDSISMNSSRELSIPFRHSNIVLDSNLVDALCELPASYSRQRFISFLKEFGTHIIVKVRYGSVSFNRTWITPAEGEGGRQIVTEDDSQDAFDWANYVLEDDSQHQHDNRRGEMKIYYKENTPISITLRNISYFLTKPRLLASNLPESCKETLTSDELLVKLRENIDQAIMDYAEQVANSHKPVRTPTTTASTTTSTATSARPVFAVRAPTSTAKPVVLEEQIPMQVDLEIVDDQVHWPSGTYGLLEATSGCPEGNWRKGQRFQDLEDLNNRRDAASGLQQKTATQLTDEGIRLNFCVKTTEFSTHTRPWPAGTYCLFKKGLCPVGFSMSYVDHDDEDHHNGNSAEGVLPDGRYDSNTRYYFCCRDDGDPDEPINLPTEKPFILLQADITRCQQVGKMRAEKLHMFTDCEDGLLGFGKGCRLSTTGTAHPGLLSILGDWQWHFCYYSTASLTNLLTIPVPHRFTFSHDQYLRDLFRTFS